VYLQNGNYYYDGNYYNRDYDDVVVDGNENTNGYFTVQSLLVNSHTCSAAFFTNKAYQQEYIWQTPESSMILCGITAVVMAVVMTSWSLCGGNAVVDETGTLEDGDFVPAPTGDKNQHTSGTATSAQSNAVLV
jgi:hypothetical protein